MGTWCSSEFWASSHFDTQPAERSLGPSVSDCCLGPGPVQTGPFPTRVLLIFPFPVCGVSWTCWIRESRLVSEGCFTSGKLLLTCIQVIPCPPTARACLPSLWCLPAYLWQHRAAWALFAASAPCLHPLCASGASQSAEQSTHSLTLDSFAFLQSCLLRCWAG